MSNEIMGIAVYPRQKFNLKKNENNDFFTPGPHLVPTNCRSGSIKCYKNVITPMEPAAPYNIVCDINVENKLDLNKMGVEGSIIRKSDSSGSKSVLIRKQLDNNPNEKGNVRQVWDWPKNPNWEKTGIYEVELKLIVKKTNIGDQETSTKFPFTVEFTKPDYKNGNNIDPDCS